jgi:hypothetical protein
MAMKNAPKKWNEIYAVARSCGAADWAMRKWLQRKKIPGDWKLKIYEASKRKISFTDMEIVETQEAAE